MLRPIFFLPPQRIISPPLLASTDWLAFDSFRANTGTSLSQTVNSLRHFRVSRRNPFLSTARHQSDNRLSADVLPGHRFPFQNQLWTLS